MISKQLTLVVAAFIFLFSVNIAESQTNVVAESGDWRVFKSNDSCGLGTGGKSSLAIFYFNKNNAYALDIINPDDWDFPGDPAVIIQDNSRLVLDRDDGAQQDNIIQFKLSDDEIKILLASISTGTRLKLQFPNSSNDGGFISLKGGSKATAAFSRCVAEQRQTTGGRDNGHDVVTPTFNISFDAFRLALDEKIRSDTTDKAHPDANTIKDCIKSGNDFTCTFRDTGFQNTIKEFKKLDLMNGNFQLLLKLRVVTENGKVSRITIAGDRGDPANMFQFTGMVVNTIQTFDPDVSQGNRSIKQLADELGLMRGDSADDIGKPRTAIKPYAVIQCLAQPSRITTHVECRFLPRS